MNELLDPQYAAIAAWAAKNWLVLVIGCGLLLIGTFAGGSRS